MKVFSLLFAFILPFGLLAQITFDSSINTLGNRSLLRKSTTTAVPSLRATHKKSFQGNSPYEWKWLQDGIWTGAGIGTSYLGLRLIRNKDSITEEKLAEEMAAIDNINFLDKWVVGNHSIKAEDQGNIILATSFATPLLLFLNDETKENMDQIAGLYIESLATTAAMYTMVAALVNKSRPYVYDDSGDTSLDKRLSKNGQRSFYSGHVAATATATFFTAKVFSDFNPEASGKVWIWAGAATLPVALGYVRLEAGQHFLTDAIVGYALGAITGYLVPELHKTKIRGLKIYPSQGLGVLGEKYTGLSVSYAFNRH